MKGRVQYNIEYNCSQDMILNPLKNDLLNFIKGVKFQNIPSLYSSVCLLPNNTTTIKRQSIIKADNNGKLINVLFFSLKHPQNVTTQIIKAKYSTSNAIIIEIITIFSHAE